MPAQGASSKFGLCPRGLIPSLLKLRRGIAGNDFSLSPREKASDAGLLFAWFGEERLEKKNFLVWGPRSQIPTDKKNNVFPSNSTKNTSDLKISSGYGQSRASYLENLLSELRSDQTRRSYSRKTQKRVLDFRYCTVTPVLSRIEYFKLEKALHVTWFFPG